MSLKLLRGPRTRAESQEQWATLGAYKPSSPLAWIKVLKESPEELWTSLPRSHQRPAEARGTYLSLAMPNSGFRLGIGSKGLRWTMRRPFYLPKLKMCVLGGLKEGVGGRGEDLNLSGTVQW